MSANYTPEKEDLKILTPFKMQVLTNFPYIEADFDALTNYQLLCKVVEYLNEVITETNEVTEQTLSLYNAFVSLQNYVNTEISDFETSVNTSVDNLETFVNNYFDNLDVQNEINNKLDAMAQDGSLTNLIKDYVDPIYQSYESNINNIISTQNDNITIIDDKVNAATSGSPAGVYATVSDLTTADPDHTRIYVVSGTGNWYYYANNQWNSGGTYQGTVVGESDPIYKYLNNLINLQKITLSSYTDNYYFNSDLTKSSNNSFYLVDPIEVKKGETLILYATSINAGVSVITVTDSEEHPMYPANRGIDSSSNYYIYRAKYDSYVMLSILKNDTNVSCYKGIDSTYLLEQNNNFKRLNNNNLFNKNDITAGYVNPSNGHFMDSTGWYYTKKLIPVENNKIYKFFGGSCFISEYGEDYTYINTTTYSTTTGTITTSNTTKYVRLSVNGTYLDSYMFCDSSYSGDYEEYFEGYSSSNILDLNTGYAIKYHTINVGPLETFTTITSALNNISDNSYFNRYILFIKKGTYNEMIHCKNYVDLIGEDKYQSIIHYISDDESDRVNRSTIYCDYNCNIENLTIETTGTKYPIHIDNFLGSFIINIKNCYIKHNGFTTIENQAGTAIGIGLYQGQNVNIEKCDIIATPNATLYGAAGIYCHNQAGGGNGYRSLTVKNCNINATTYGIRLDTIESSDQGQKNDAFIIVNNNSASYPLRQNGTVQSWNVIEY